MEYAYMDDLQRWATLSVMDKASPPDDVVEDLENNKITKKFVELDNTQGAIYPGLAHIAPRIFIDISDIKLLLGDEYFYRYEVTPNSTSRTLLPQNTIINVDILPILKENQDLTYVVDLLDRFAYLPAVLYSDDLINYQRHRRLLKLLDTNQRLYYELEGHYPGRKGFGFR